MSKPNARQGVRLVVATTPEEKARWHAQIERAYKSHAWDALQRKIGKGIIKSHGMASIRLSELECLFIARHGEQRLTDDDAGREYLEIAAHHIAHLHGEVEKHIIAWARCWAPWMPSDESERLAKRVAAKPRKWKADSLARELNVTKAERDALGLTTIGAVDFPKRQRTKARKEKRSRRDRQRSERAAKAEGRILRARPGQPRKTATPPWVLLGVPRSTYYRRKKLGETSILTQQGLEGEGREYSSHASPGHAAAAAPVEASVVSFRGAKTGQRKPTHHWPRHQEQERKAA